MPSLEEVGRKIDAEIDRLRRLFETEVRPTTERRAAELLRAASQRLADLAGELESRNAPSAGPPPGPVEPQ